MEYSLLLLDVEGKELGVGECYMVFLVRAGLQESQKMYRARNGALGIRCNLPLLSVLSWGLIWEGAYLLSLGPADLLESRVRTQDVRYSLLLLDVLSGELVSRGLGMNHLLGVPGASGPPGKQAKL